MSKSGKTLSLAMVGIAGHGDIYLGGLLSAPASAGFRLVGAIDPHLQRSSRLAELKARGVPCYRSLEAFYAVDTADVVILATPPSLHCPQTCLALGHGSHVFCEKPLGTHPQQIEQMLRAQRLAQKQVAIGYQWSFSPAIQDLKRDINDGLLGRPLRFKSMVLWPRGEAYYQRNSWSGRLRDDHGNWVCDSPLNNACAHHLHNLFYLLGSTPNRSAWPSEVTAELYRAYPIQNYDTAVLRSLTDSSVEVFCVVSHATHSRKEPSFHLECEEATVTFAESRKGPIVAQFRNGQTKVYGEPHDGFRMDKVWQTLSAARDGTSVVCGVEAAASQTACMWAAQQSSDPIVEFPPQLIRSEGTNGHERRWVQGLDAELERCYAMWKLPSELALPWSNGGRKIKPAVTGALAGTDDAKVFDRPLAHERQPTNVVAAK